MANRVLIGERFEIVETLPANVRWALKRDQDGFYYECKGRGLGVNRVILGSDLMEPTLCHADDRVYDSKSEYYAAIERAGCHILEPGEKEEILKKGKARTGFEKVTEQDWDQAIRAAKTEVEQKTGEKIEL